MVIDAVDGPVTIYIANSYFHDNGFEVAPAFGSPMAVAFMIDAQQDIVFPSNAKVRGAYYAPIHAFIRYTVRDIPDDRARDLTHEFFARLLAKPGRKREKAA